MKNTLTSVICVMVVVIIFSSLSNGLNLNMAINEAGHNTLSVLGNTISNSSILYINGYSFDTNIGEPSIQENRQVQRLAPGETGVFILHFTGPIMQEWVDTIEELGIEIVNYIPNFAYQVRMTNDQAQLARDLPFIDWFGDYQPAYKISSKIKDSQVTVSLEGQNIPDSALEQVRSWMKVTKEGATGTGYIFYGLLYSVS